MTASQINPTMGVLAHIIEPSNDPTLTLGQVTREKKNLWSIKLPTRLDGHFYISLELSFPKPCPCLMWFLLQPIASGCLADVIYSTPHHSMERQNYRGWYGCCLVPGTWYLVPRTWDDHGTAAVVTFFDTGSFVRRPYKATIVMCPIQHSG